MFKNRFFTRKNYYRRISGSWNFRTNTTPVFGFSMHMCVRQCCIIPLWIQVLRADSKMAALLDGFFSGFVRPLNFRDTSFSKYPIIPLFIFYNYNNLLILYATGKLLCFTIFNCIYKEREFHWLLWQWLFLHLFSFCQKNCIIFCCMVKRKPDCSFVKLRGFTLIASN